MDLHLESKLFEPTLRDEPATKTDEYVLGKMLDAVIILASCRTESIEAVAEVFGVLSENIIGDDPEHANVGRKKRIQEPISNSPVVPTIFKIEQLRKYFEDIHYQREMKLVSTKSAEAWQQALPESDITAVQQFLEMATRLKAEQYANEHLILGSDVVLRIDDVDVHSYQRDKRKRKPQEDFITEGQQLAERIFADAKIRHQEPTKIEWDCAFGLRFQGLTRVAEIVISTHMPALSPEDPNHMLLLRAHIEPRISGGVKLLELLEYIPEVTFMIRDAAAPEEENIPISREDAQWLIVNKVLTRNLYNRLLNGTETEYSLDGKYIGREQISIPLAMVPVILGSLAEI